MKICAKCHIEKKEDCFHKRTKNKDGLYCYCKQCVQFFTKQYYENNRDLVLVSNKRYRLKNKNKVKATQNKWNSKNKDNIRRYARVKMNRRTLTLSDSYIKKRLKDEGVNYNIISSDLIELKRTILKIKRQSNGNKQKNGGNRPTLA